MEAFDVIPINLKNNFLALQNCAYLPHTKWKDPSATIHLKIKQRYIKCKFSDQVKDQSIGMSKNIRDYLQLDTVHSVKAQPIVNIDESKLYIRSMTVQISVRKREKQTGDVPYHQPSFIQQIKNKQKSVFLNHGQTFYVYLDNITYLCQIKSLIPQHKRFKSSEDAFGIMNKNAQIKIQIHPNDPLLNKGSSNGQNKAIFKSQIKNPNDMGIGGLNQELGQIFRRAFVSRRFDDSIVDKFGVKHVKGILLFGPPGTGKTLIARQLSKALNIDERNYKKVDGPEIFNKYVGQSEANIRKLFEKARQDQKEFGPKSPLHVIVFDEIDAICKQRGVHSVGAQVNDQVVNQLLSNIDGVDALNNILLIGMTNRIDLLDEAILRPGRFEVHIEVKLPTEKGRQQIFNIHTKKLQNHELLDRKCKIQELSRMTKNYTGAEIESVIKAAVSHAILRSTNILNFSEELKIDEKNLRLQLQDFIKAVDEIKPQFGTDDEKFEGYLKENPIDYGEVFERINAELQQKTAISEGSHVQLKSVLMYGPLGTGKTTFAMNFAKKKNFPFTKIISPFNILGKTESEKIEQINEIFENAYKTSKACIIISNIERVINYTSSVSSLISFSNHILQSLMLLIRKVPPRKQCKLLIVGITSLSSVHSLRELQLTETFESCIQVPKLTGKSIETILIQKFKVNEKSARKISSTIGYLTFQQILDIHGLVQDKDNVDDWIQTYEYFIKGKIEIFA